MPRYPTKEEVLAPGDNGVLHGEIGPLKTLGGGRWFSLAKTDRKAALAELRRFAEEASALRGIKPPEVWLQDGDVDRYENGRIYLGSLSLVTFLHELGHHFFGSSELKACRYSVALFRLAMPKAYEKLEWHGHMLVKKS